ncbi:MAG: transcriptional regulator [Frankiales bacterium]|nr:transcriptional regulator [Frankiales bacterium]
MSEPVQDGAPARRASYGPHSPRVGSRGGETRQRLVDLALVAFGADGYWGMSIDDLCRRAGVSRATFYQYFRGKGELFEKLSSDTGADILALGHRLGPLSPDSTGVDNVHAWLHEFQQVYLRHAPVFELWSEAIFDSPGLRAMGERFLSRYSAALAERLGAAGMAEDDAFRLALAVLGTAERISLISTRSSASRIDESLAALAVTVQVMLFPQTPEAALQTVLTRAAPRS